MAVKIEWYVVPVVSVWVLASLSTNTQEQLVIQSLQPNKDIAIKLADADGVVGVMNTSDYI